MARWQLLDAGLTEDAMRHVAAQARRVGSGVWMTGHAPPSRRQLWWAAVVGAPGRLLAGASAGAAWGFRSWQGRCEVVVSAGSGGPRRYGDVLVCRSGTLDADALDGLPITTVERTVLDLAAGLPARDAVKAAREAIRLGLTDAARLRERLERARGRRGVARLRVAVEALVSLPISRCRSDAEARALELLAAAALPAPRVNVLVAGLEADLSWPGRRLIVEIDGPRFHRLRDEDARRTATWRAAGWHVLRVPSSVVFDQPEAFVAAIRAERPKPGVRAPGKGRSAPRA